MAQLEARSKGSSSPPAHLPPELAPWTPWLSWFSPPLRAPLGELMLRLHSLIGTPSRNNQRGDQEPDGLADLRTRGAYERLLATEWLLAEELPDEFLRRAVNAEHLFLAPRRQAQPRSRLFVALFDAGPLQLGAPRLAHIASWMLLARRAAQAGGRLCWGVQQMPGRLHEAAQPSDLKALLQARTFDGLQSAHHRQWRAFIGEQAEKPQELWLVGASSAEQYTGDDRLVATHRIGLSRMIHADTNALQVMVHHGSATREATLPLPDPDVASHLLKGHFMAPSRTLVHDRASERIALKRPLLSFNGGKAALHLLDGSGLLIVPIPALVAKAGVKKRSLMHWPHGTEPLALSFANKQPTALHVAKGRDLLAVWNSPLGVFARSPMEDFHAIPPGTGSSMPAASLKASSMHQYLVVDRAARLLRWQRLSKDKSAVSFDRIDEQVLGLWQEDQQQALYVARYAGWFWVRRYHITGKSFINNYPLCAADGDAVLFGGGTRWRIDVGACAVRIPGARGDGEQWRLNVPLNKGRRQWGDGPNGPGTMPFRAIEVALPAGWSAIGVVPEPVSEGGYVLIALDKVRKGLHAHDGQRGTLLYASPSRISSASVCPQSGVVAMLTEHREFIAFGAIEKGLRTIVHFGEDASSSC